MNNGQGSIFGIQQQQPGSEGNSKIIIQSLHELTKWVPMTDQGVAVVQGALGLIGQLQRSNQSIVNDPYWQLRKFGEAMLSMTAPFERTDKRIFFYDYEKNEVYMGYPAVLEQELPPIVLKATLGVEAVVTLSLDEAVAAVQEVGKRIQNWVFGMEFKEEARPNPLSPEANLDWSFTMDLGDSLFENDFKANFIFLAERANVHRPDLVYDTFKDKFSLSAVLNGPNRSLMDLRVFSVNEQQYYEWIFSK